MEKNNQERVRSIWKPLCLLFAALLTLSWVFFGVLYSNGNVNFSTLETPEQEQSVSGGMVIGESVGSGVKLMSTEIAHEDYAVNGISPMAESAYTLTATITPDNATNKAVDWSVAFVNPSSAWASGKTVTDYVTVTPTSDGALTANVECLQDFGEQIKVIVSSRDYPSAKAECMVDYRQRILSVKFNYSDSSDTSYSFTSADTSVVIQASVLKFDDVTVEYSDYTLADTFEGSFVLSGTEEMFEEINEGEDIGDLEIEYLNFTEDSILTNNGIFFSEIARNYSENNPIDGFYSFYEDEDEPERAYSAYGFIRSSCETIPFAHMSATYTGTYSSFTFEIDLFTKPEWWVVPAENVILDKSEIVF